MVALQHKLVGQLAEVDVFEMLPHTIARDDMLLADALCHVLLYLVLVHNLGVQRVAVVELHPLQLLRKLDGMVNVGLFVQYFLILGLDV